MLILLKKMKWNRSLRGVRAVLPIAYTALLLNGLVTKNIVIMLVLMGSTLLGGAWFCGWLCPFGFAQDWTARVARFLRIPRLRIPVGIEKYFRFLRYVLLALSFTGLAFVLFVQTPYGSAMGLVDRNLSFVTQGAWILLGAFLFLSLFVDRPFCRYFCPEGARYGLISLARVFTIKRDESKCVSCGSCDRRCPAQIEVSGSSEVRNAQCINCFECIAACPVKGTLSYGWAFSKKPR